MKSPAFKNYRNLQVFSQEDLSTPKHTFAVYISGRYDDVFDEFLQKVVPDKVWVSLVISQFISDDAISYLKYSDDEKKIQFENLIKSFDKVIKSSNISKAMVDDLIENYNEIFSKTNPFK